MKKIQLLVILVLSIFLVISCSHNDEEEELDNSGDNTSQDGENSGDTLPETIGNDEDKTDTASESGDSDALDDTDMPDNDNDPTDDSNDSDDTDISDTGMPDNDNDPADDPDDSDDIDTTDIDTLDNDDDTDTGTTNPDTDSGDSQPDDDGDTSAPEQPTFPECSPASAKPCISGNLIWSETKKTKRTQGGCNTDCNNLNEAGYSSGWRLPTINELRTLVQNCSKTVSLPDGVCQVSDTCIKTLCKDEDNCKCSSGNDYSKLGDTDSLWSGTKVESNMSAAWYINFSNAYIDSTNTSDKKSARCVHEIK